MNGPHPHNPHLQLQMQQQFSGEQHRGSIDSNNTFSTPVQKQETASPTGDLSKAGPSDEKKPQGKPAKTLNRVPRAYFYLDPSGCF